MSGKFGFDVYNNELLILVGEGNIKVLSDDQVDGFIGKDSIDGNFREFVNSFKLVNSRWRDLQRSFNP